MAIIQDIRNFVPSWQKHLDESGYLKADPSGDYHQKAGYNFKENFPNTPEFVADALGKAYQYSTEGVGSLFTGNPSGEIVDYLDSTTKDPSWAKRAKEEARLNSLGFRGQGFNMDEYNQTMDFARKGFDPNTGLTYGSAQASIPTQDDMIKAGIQRQMINEGTATPMARRTYGNMSMGYGRPEYVADRSPVAQALKATEIPELKVAGVPNYSEFDDFESYLQGDPKTYKQGIFSPIKNAAKKYSAPIKQGIGTLMSMASGIPGLGLLMNSFTPNPSDAMSKSFAVENYGNPYNYNMGSGNLTGKDPFGINTVSMFGNYPGYYDQYAQDYEAGKYSLTSKFAKDKYQHALNVGKANLDRIEKDYGSTNKTFNWQDHEQDKGGDVPGGGNFNTSKSGMKEGAFGTYDGSPGRKDYGRGGLASLWRR